MAQSSAPSRRDRAAALRGIRARLGALALAVALLLSGLVAFRAWQRNGYEQERLKGQALELVDVVVRALEAEIRSTESYLTVVGQLVDPDSSVAWNDSVLAVAYGRVRQPYTNVMLLDTTRRSLGVAVVPRDGRGARRAANRPVFDRAIATGRLGVGEVVRSRVRDDGAFVTYFYLPLVDGRTGRTRAVVATAIPIDSLDALQIGRTLPPGSVITVMDTTATILMRTLDPDHWIGRSYAGDPRILDDFAVDQRVAAARSDDGTLRFIAFKRMPSTNWRVYVGIPQSATLGRVRAQLLGDLAVGALITLIVLVGAWQIGRRIVTPIESLTADARAITAGDEARRSTVRTDDELGELAAAFNQMADTAAERREALLASQDQLRQVQKMEALGAFAGGIAHDFNNYLAAIGGFAEIAAFDVPAGTEARAALDEVLRTTGRASELTRQILVFSRRQVVQPEVIDPARVVRDVETLLAPLMGAAYTVEVTLAHEGARIRADRGQLEQVLVNLGINARDAMPAGGRFALAVRRVTVRRGDAVPAGVAPGDWVVVSASDDGPGIDAAVRARLFEPFFTTKARGQGTGLGLALAWGIVQQAGGTIDVESAPREGTTFHVWLPVVDAPLAVSTPEAGTRMPSGGDETLLVVEDDAAVRGATAALLRRAGYTVIESEQATAALQQLAAGGVALVVSDVVMPGMHGATLARRVQALHPGVPVLLMSGYADDEQLSQVVGTPGIGFLAKPFAQEALLRAVRELLDGR
ncbi:MAG: response regulator [Gemmatimonadaceae bacterium]|nr:response regulator [Gemmatimonadaceae bacterium]